MVTKVHTYSNKPAAFSCTFSILMVTESFNVETGKRKDIDECLENFSQGTRNKNY